jgi:hypothetical protein
VPEHERDRQRGAGQARQQQEGGPEAVRAGAGAAAAAVAAQRARVQRARQPRREQRAACRLVLVGFGRAFSCSRGHSRFDICTAGGRRPAMLAAAAVLAGGCCNAVLCSQEGSPVQGVRPPGAGGTARAAIVTESNLKQQAKHVGSTCTGATVYFPGWNSTSCHARRQPTHVQPLAPHAVKAGPRACCRAQLRERIVRRKVLQPEQLRGHGRHDALPAAAQGGLS